MMTGTIQIGLVSLFSTASWQIVLVGLFSNASAFIETHGKICQDRLNNCANHGRAVCKASNWRDWARVNCKRYCGFCSDNVTNQPAVSTSKSSTPAVLNTMSNVTVLPHVRTTKAMVTIPPKDITCAVCAGPPEACELAYYETTCHPPNHYCINHITTKETGQRLVERRCGNIHDCYNDWYLGSSDDDKCRQLSAANILTYNFECSYCCIKDGCNVDLHPKHDTLYMNL